MQRSLIIATALGIATSLSAQPAISRAIIRPVLPTGSQWVSGIAVPASGRFMIYGQDSTIEIVNSATKRSYTIRIAVTPNDDSNVGVSRSGNLLTFVRPDDGGKGPFVWAQTLDSLTGEPRGVPAASRSSRAAWRNRRATASTSPSSPTMATIISSRAARG